MSRTLALASLLLAGCTTAPETTFSEGGTSLRDLPLLDGSGDKDPVIFGGDAPDAPEHDAVVALHQVTRWGVYTSPFCTGTLVTDDVIVTAAHCLDTAGGGGSFKTMKASELAIYVGDDPSVDIASHLYAVSETQIYSGYDRRRLLNDIAIVRLSTPITEGYAPVPHLPAGSGWTTGETLNFAGFGQTETGDSGVKLQADGSLGALGCGVSGCPSSGDSATQISYSQRSGTGPCFGDSGGPAFVTRSGTVYLGGITSYGDSYCTTYGVSTRVDAFETWIDDFIGTGDTGTPGDGGATDGGATDGGATDGGGTGGTCGDGVCGTGESCDGRDGTTACGDCAGVTSGKPSNRWCEVEGVCEGPGC